MAFVNVFRKWEPMEEETGSLYCEHMPSPYMYETVTKGDLKRAGDYTMFLVAIRWLNNIERNTSNFVKPSDKTKIHIFESSLRIKRFNRHINTLFVGHAFIILRSAIT